ncbi:MAG TPA: hypothetical protein PLK44_13890 [Aestuariivirga sp.]|nr:hypothetical protein [Hyphomicrobiales bacterium]HQY74801.1 hypothetical protein [Aestuariivirga sp.]HRA93675.1 hypothetical protein [Aestuariivirga sp.]
MANYADPKTKTVSETDGRPGVHVTQTSKGSGATIAYVIAALVVIVGAYLLFFNNPGTAPVVPSVTQNNTTVAPEPVTPVPETPPAMEQTAPAAPAPVTPAPAAPAQ